MINDDFSRGGKLRDVGRWYVTRFVEGVARALPEGASVLDAGAGECVYKRLFAHCRYSAMDGAIGDQTWNYRNLNFVAKLHELPLGDGVFDAVLCTQVFEHLEWPRESARELCRIVKPGGRLYLTVPMSQGEHQAPHDYFRYTSFGLRSILGYAGFREVKVVPFGGFWVRLASELPRGLHVLPGSGLRSGEPNPAGIALLPVKAALWLTLPVLQALFLWLDRFDAKKSDPFGWACEATK